MRLVNSAALIALLSIVSTPGNGSAEPTRIALKVRAKLAAPLQRRPMAERRFDFEEPEKEVVTFAWDEVPGATAYVFELDDDDGFQPPLNRDHRLVLGDPKATVEVTGLGTGGYYWRVAAVDASGAQGPWSELGRFSVNEGAPPDTLGPAPKLELTDQTPIGPRVIVRGIASTAGRLEAYINGEHVADVPVGADGTFSFMFEATVIGTNVAEFVAINKNGRTTRKQVEFSYLGN